MEFGEYLGTPEGDRLSTLAAGYRMTFCEKIDWSETSEAFACHARQARGNILRKSLLSWIDKAD